MCGVVGADAWRKALNSNQKLVRTVSVNRGTDDHREREVDASIFSLSHNTHMTNAAICCVPTRCTTTTSVCIPLLFASCFVYMVLSYVLNEILNSHEHSFRNERQNGGITKVSHCIQFSWANATVLFDLALVQSHFFRVFFFSSYLFWVWLKCIASVHSIFILCFSIVFFFLVGRSVGPEDPFDLFATHNFYPWSR